MGAAIQARDLSSQSVLVTGAKNRMLLWLSLGVATSWVAGLIALAVLTSNPDTLNPRQLDQSDVIVVGDILDRRTGAVRVKEYLIGEGPEVITIQNLAETGARTGRRYLFPLGFADSESYWIASNLPPDRETGQSARPGTLIYNWSAEVRAQFDRIRDGAFGGDPESRLQTGVPN